MTDDSKRRFTFGKQEHLTAQKQVDLLFNSAESRSAMAFPLRAVWHRCERQEADCPVQVLISVPKRRLRHAVDRNRVKRQVRQCYRLNKYQLIDSLPAGERLLLGFVWQTDRLLATSEVEQRVVRLLNRIARAQ